MGEEEEAGEEDRHAVRDGSCGCDFCGEAAAAVYCRADAARLCLGCDRQVHAANSVSSQHPRALLCDACRAAPSAFLCSSPHRLLLCSNCDFDAHSGCDGLHNRRPVEPFSGCPSALELASIFGFGGDEKLVVSGFPVEEEGGGDGGDGWLFADEGWGQETSPVISLEDLIVPITSFHGFQAMGIPPLPKKNRNIACGKHKEEILRQLRELIKSETHVRNDHGEIEPIIESQSLVQQQNHQQGYLSSNFDQDATCMFVPNSEATTLQWNHSDCHEPEDTVAFSFEQLVGSSSIVNESFLDGTAGVETSACHASGDDRDARHPDDKEKIPSLLPKGGHESGCPDRDSAISRYKEKRKTRRYDKLIRYESRKARADSRMRIKGRFAKANRVSES